MADDEQFSLCWNNFNTNLSAGFHESLCRGDLVDVTLAAEGQFVKAHRLVLSVCSPYFRKMFTTMPANQHAFVFLKDVSHSALKDLIQFMYCGEVNVKQDALPAFISTAEALQIKGLTDGDPAPAQSPTKHSTPAHQTLTRVRQPATRPQQTTTSRSYKIETIDDSGDEVLVGGKTTTQIVLQTSAPPTQTAPQQSQNVVQTNQGTTVVSQKRPAGQRSISSAQTKRIKTQTVVSVQQNDPLEAVGATETTTLQAVQSVAPAADKSDTEFIDLPIDLPTKSEPDYSNAEDAGEVDQTGEQETYVEDDSYGDMKYDESYFTENEDQTATGATATSVTTSTPAIKQQFGETSYTESGDQSGAEAQERLLKLNRNIVVRQFAPSSSQDESMEVRMNKIEVTLNTFQSSVLDILGAIRVDMSEIMKQPRPYNFEEETDDDYSIFKRFIPLDTMEKFDSFDLQLTDATFRDSFMKFLKTIGGRDGESLRNMTRTIFDDAVLCEFTWEGTATKRALKCTTIISVFLKVLEGSTVHDLKSFFSPYLRNAPVRFRNRVDRKKIRNHY